MALPIALQSLIGSSLNLVDNIMVGRLGEVEVSAVGVGIQPFFLFWMVMFGFTSGSAAFMSQFWGAHDTKNIKKTLGFAVCVCASIALLFFTACRFFPEVIVNVFTDIDEIKPLAAEYIRIGSFCFLFLCVTAPVTFCLRSTQQMKLPLLTSTFSFCTNTFLNYVLIFGHFGAPALGVAGAAIATVVARGLEVLLLLFIVFRGKNVIAGKLREYFGWTKSFASRIFQVAIPTTLNEALWAAGIAMYVVAYARVGTTEFAAVQASRAIESIFIMAAFSLGDAALILVGQRFGAGELDYGYALAKKMSRLAVVLGLFLGAFLIAIAQPVLSLYNFSPEGQRYAFYILVIYGCTMSIVLFNGIAVVGVLRSGGDTKFAMLVDCLGVWLIGVPLAFIAALWLRLPIHIAVLLVTTEELVKFVFLFRRFVSRKWVRNVIRGM